MYAEHVYMLNIRYPRKGSRNTYTPERVAEKAYTPERVAETVIPQKGMQNNIKLNNQQSMNTTILTTRKQHTKTYKTKRKTT